MTTPPGPPLRESCAELAAAVAMLLAETGGPFTPAQEAAADALERARAAGIAGP